MKIQLIEDFLEFRKNKTQFKLWLAIRRTGEENASKVESGLGEFHGQQFATHNGEVYLTCECADENCKLGDFVNQQSLMDVQSPSVKLIHKECVWSGVAALRFVGELGSFIVCIIK